MAQLYLKSLLLDSENVCFPTDALGVFFITQRHLASTIPPSLSVAVYLYDHVTIKRPLELTVKLSTCDTDNVLHYQRCTEPFRSLGHKNIKLHLVATVVRIEWLTSPALLCAYVVLDIIHGTVKRWNWKLLLQEIMLGLHDIHLLSHFVQFPLICTPDLI